MCLYPSLTNSRKLNGFAVFWLLHLGKVNICDVLKPGFLCLPDVFKIHTKDWSLQKEWNIDASEESLCVFPIPVRRNFMSISGSLIYTTSRTPHSALLTSSRCTRFLSRKRFMFVTLRSCLSASLCLLA